MDKASRKKQSFPHELNETEKEHSVSSTPLDKESFFSNPVIHVLIIVVLGFLAYSNTFQNPFQWDEADFIVGNPIIKNLGYFTDISRAEGLPVYDGLKSRYIGYLTFALNYKLHGFNVLGYHVVNLAIHLTNAILVYFFILLTFRTPYFNSEKSKVKSEKSEHGKQVSEDLSLFTFHLSRVLALAVALLFVAHPLQTEAVTYIFQRLASLVSMFYLLSLVLYIKGRQIQVEAKVKVAKTSASNLRPHSSISASALTCFILSFLFAVLAMKTKENAFTLPVIITLYEFLFFSGPVKTRLLRLAPFLLTMLIVPLTIMGTGSTPGEIISQVKDPVSLGYITPTPADYLFTQFRVIVTYIRLLFLPVNQTLLYDYPIYQSLFAPPVFMSFLLLAAIFAGAVYLLYKSKVKSEKLKVNSKKPEISVETVRGKNGESDDIIHLSPFTFHLLRIIAFGILWFFITLSVESGIIPIPVVIDEYRVYLPSVGFFLALVAGVVLLLKQGSRFIRLGGPACGGRFTVSAVALFALVILLLAAATYARNTVWKDRVSLWEDIVRKSPGFGMGYDNLGLVYEELGRREEAVEQFRKAIQLAPGVPTPHINLGYTLEAMGRLDEAITEYQTVLRLDPRNRQAHLNMGNAYGRKGLPDKAIEHLQAALKVAPNSAAAYINLGNAYRQKGDVDKAIDQYLSALRLEPDYAEAHYNLGDAYEGKKELDKAIGHYLAAVRSKPDYVRAHYNLGRVYVQVKRLDDAIAELRVAASMEPKNSAYLNILGVLYGQKGLYDEAIKQFEEAIRLAPDTAAYRQNLERAREMKSKQ